MDKLSTLESRLKLASLQVEYALTTLSDVLKVPEQSNRIHIDAAIQRFEYTIELFWKFLKHLLASQGIEALSPKQALKEAFSMKLISNEQVWLNMQNDRNLTSHSYNIELADQIFARIKLYYPLMKSTFQKLKIEFIETEL